MSMLRIYPEADPSQFESVTEPDAIRAALKGIDVQFEQWPTGTLADEATSEQVLAAYNDDVERIMKTSGFKSVDVIGLGPDHPEKAAFRAKFLEEHTHSEFEIRFFVDGSGQFNLHKNDKVYEIRCEKGDLLSVPAGTPHWFDMGPNPSFRCIRFFTSANGWAAQFTGSDIAQRFPRFE